MEKSKMKRVTKNNLLILLEWIKEYEQNKDAELLKVIDNFINNVINKDNRYYSKLDSYEFNNDQLKYLI